MDGSVESFLKIAAIHARYGTTAMVPTTLTSEKESLLDILEVYKEATNRNMMGAEFLGYTWKALFLHEPKGLSRCQVYS